MRRENKFYNNTQIRVVGVGGGGSNAVNHMISAGLQNIQFISINTDHQSLANSKAPNRIQIGKQVTQGLGTGGNPTKGKRAAYEAKQDIKNALKDTDILFITAGLGGGTGSGAAPIIANIAQELGILTIAVVTRPFRFEGNEPTQIAKEAIKELEKNVDSLIVFPNDRLFSLSNERTSFKDSFRIADNIISQGVQAISEFVDLPGLINLDFANLKTIMAMKGATLITVGHARGIDRAKIAAGRALVCPTLGLSVHGARGMLINITASSSLDLREIRTITKVLKDTTHVGADFILGTIIDEKMGDEIRVTVIATGFCNEIWDIWANYEQPRRKKQPAIMVTTESDSNTAKSNPDKKMSLGFSLRNFPIPSFLQGSHSQLS